jgi:site-specific DNA-methyltransferase (adenine-specific)
MSEIDLSKKLNLIQGDCLEVLKQLPDKSIDLILTDPPYGINIASNKTVGGKGVCKNTIFEVNDWDKQSPDRIYFEEMLRVGRKIIIFGGNYFSDKLPTSGAWLIWDKRCEDKHQNNFADAELCWTNLQTTRIYRFLYKGMIQEDMRHKEEKLHPTQKPVALIEKMVNDNTENNNLVLDCFMGSGTTGCASLKLGRRFVGVELDEGYFRIAERRCKEWENQERLF